MRPKMRGLRGLAELRRRLKEEESIRCSRGNCTEKCHSEPSVHVFLLSWKVYTSAYVVLLQRSDGK